MSKTIVIQGSRSSSGNSILSYITPWLGRILGIVILIVVIIAIAKLLGGNIFGALQGLLGTANAASHALTNQITSCGFAAPPTVSCDSSQKNPCINKQKCSAGQCIECTNDNDCEDRYDSGYTCASTGMCKAPGFPGGLFNNGCMIGWGFLGYLSLQVITALGVAFFSWAKSKFVKKIEAITGKPALDGVPVEQIVKDAMDKENEATEKEIKAKQEAKKLPYQDSESSTGWRDAEPPAGTGEEISEDAATAKINKARETFRDSYLKDVPRRAITNSITNEAKNKMATNPEAQNQVTEARSEDVAEHNNEIDRLSEETDGDSMDANGVEEAAEEIVPFGE